MDWRSLKFDWNRARAFLVTAEEGSLAAAARSLGMAQPTLGRQVAALEQELGVQLFQRHGRGLTLTDSGIELLEHVRSMGEAANRLSLGASGRATAIEGEITLSAPELTAMHVLPPILRELRREQPGIRVEIIASNQESNLSRREADIAIRSFRPTQPELIARKVGMVTAHLYASPDYLASLEDGTTPAGLSHADFIGSDYQHVLLSHLNQHGLTISSDQFSVSTSNHIVQWELVKQGLGVGMMVEQIANAEPGVVRVLPDLQPFTAEIWLVTHSELRTQRRIRTVFDFLVAEITRLYNNED